MSRQNVELVQRAYEQVSRGKIDQDLIDPGFELHENVLAPDAAVYRGPEGLTKWLEAGVEAFADFRFEAERFIDRGEWVFAPVRASGRGKESGAPFSARYVTAFRLKDGKFLFAGSYSDLAQAFEAAGLPGSG
jgi:ketosteroid isomerase-like protein